MINLYYLCRVNFRYIMEGKIEQYLEREGSRELTIKAVFFDMDGVLFDSMPYHVESWIYALGEYGIPFTSEEAYMCEGRTGASTIMEYYTRYYGVEPTQAQIDEIYGVKTRKFYEVSTVRTIDGVKELIEYFKQKGVEMYVVTGSGQKTLLNTLNAHFPGVFSRERVTSAYDVKKGKPDPEPYLIALQKSGLRKEEVIVVENAPLGVKSSSGAGLFSVAVNTGTLPDEKLYEYGADIVYKSMRELLAALNNRFL